MFARQKLKQWLLPIVVMVLLLIAFGGYVLDAIGLNIIAVNNMKGEGVAAIALQESARLTDWGECGQYHQIGREFLLNDQYDLALDPLEKGVVCNDNPWAWFDLGKAQYALGDLDGAAESWRHTSHGYRQAVILASANNDQNNLEVTIAGWEFASNVDPNEQLPYIQVARLKAESDPEAVEPLLRQAVEVNPDAPGAYIELGNYLLNKGEMGVAQEQFDQALVLDPTNVPLLVTMAGNAAELGDVPRAIELWQEVALRNERRQGLAYYQIGKLAFSDGNFSSALAFYKRAVETEPENGQFLVGMANAFAEVGCRQEAIAIYQRVIEMAPANAVVAEAELGLAELAVTNNELAPCQEIQ